MFQNVFSRKNQTKGKNIAGNFLEKWNDKIGGI
jgi:hypothetical protein